MTTSFVACLRFLKCLSLAILLGGAASSFAQVTLADQPVFSKIQVPGNVIFTLSVEFPTASVSAYYSATTYSASTQYVGYFDSAKCYIYNAINSGSSSSPNYSGSYFVPYSLASNNTCTSTSSKALWSGNYLNWAGMLSLDEFRWVLTGGTRLIDSTSMTVLERTYQSGQDGGGDAPNKTVSSASSIAGATPFNWSSLSTRIWGLGSAMALTSSGNLNGSTTAYTGQSSLGNPAASSGTVYLVYLNVQVCSPTVSLESNCVAYGSNYKPEGLMQKYSSQLRYSAIGYLNDSNVLRDGGVMRAALKFIGPTQPVPGSTNIANSLAEWSSTTGIMVGNPNPSDATSTTNAAASAGGSAQITQSGVMNYLNKFGYTSGSYKTYDPVSELYYVAIRYLKNPQPTPAVPEYSSLTASGTSASAIQTWLDGFPVLTSYPDPILYSCQKNFIIGIGDEHTWQDANLPGSALIPSGYEPSEPNTVVADTSVNVKTATNMIGQLEGTGNIGNGYFGGGANAATYYIAGLAYDSHTNNMRPDLSTASNPVNVTVATYWLDVLEQPGYQSRNQYYYATKYGGFTVPNGFSPYAASNGPSTLPLTSWYNSTNTLTGTNGVVDKQPDNFFTANNALAMQSSLNSVFSNIIAANTGSNSTAFSPPSATVTSGSTNYAATYDPATWTGVLSGGTVTYATDGTPSVTSAWDARALLSASTVTSGTRKIITCCTTSTTSGALGLPFTAAALSAATLNSRTSSYSSTFNAVPNASSQSTSNYISYLRGDTSKEIANGGAYRTRSYRLGDIVDSKPVVVGAPASPYYEIYNSGYAAFKNTYASRSPVVYVGANDGMLHAFDGTVNGTTSGSELFAYIPSFVYGTAGTSGTATTSGLASLGNPSFVHHFLVDGTPVQADVDFGNTQGATSTTPNWHTILIGGLGKGGNGYYALDVTDPTTFTSESALSGKVLWEFTDSDMGATFGPPTVVKTKKYGWVVVVPSGYNNSTGIGHFYFINPRTGALIDEVNTPTGSTSSPINVAQLSAFVPNYNDSTADAIYAGDLAGNVWRVDVTGTATSYSATPATLLATLTDSSGNAQPVTTRPLIEIDKTTNSRYVLIGTGRLLADSDILSAYQQTFYAIKDGTGLADGFYTSTTLPTGVTFPVSRSKLVHDINLLTGITATTSQPMGWYFDMPVTSSISQRVNIDPIADGGEVVWAGNQPNGSTCAPQGAGTIYGVSFATGISALVSISTTTNTSTSIPSYAFPPPPNGGSTAVTDLDFLSVNGQVRIIAGDASGTVALVPSSVSTAVGLKQLNWRDVPVTN